MQLQRRPALFSFFARTSIWRYAAVVFVLLLTLGPLLYIGAYNHPTFFDDYTNADWTSLSAFQKRLFLRWSGRYASNLTASLCPVHWHSLRAYRVAVSGLVALFIITFTYAAARTLNHCYKLRKDKALLPGVLLTAIMVNNFPYIAEGLFWYTSVVVYLLSTVFMLWMYIICLSGLKQGRLSRAQEATLYLLAVLVVGGNEINMFLLLAALGYLLYRFRDQRHAPLYKACVRLTALSALGAVIMLAAPGNYGRLRTVHYNPLKGLLKDAYFAPHYYLNWIFSPTLLYFSAFIVYFFSRREPRIRTESLYRTVLYPLAANALMFAPTLLTTATLPMRVRNITYCIFLLLWLYHCIQTGMHLHGNAWNTTLRPLKPLFHVAAVLTGLYALNSLTPQRSGIMMVYKSIFDGTIRRYDEGIKRKAQYFVNRGGYNRCTTTGSACRQSALSLRQRGAMHKTGRLNVRSRKPECTAHRCRRDILFQPPSILFPG